MSGIRTWYPHFIDDFNRKTGHLSLAERGAYRAMIDAYWERQGPLPANEITLCRMIRALPEEWEAVRENVLPFFSERDGKLHHSRIDEEMDRARRQRAEKAERMAAARLRRWAKKPLKTDQCIDQCIDQKSDQITSQPRGSKKPLPSPLPILTDTKIEEPVLGAKAPKKQKPDIELIREALGRVLSPKYADGVIEHRKKIRKPLTVLAAEGLAKRYAGCRDGPDAAAEYHITSGNQGFEPEWYDNAKRNRGDGRNGKTAGVVDDLREVIDWAKNVDAAGGEPVSGDERESGRRAISAD